MATDGSARAVILAAGKSSKFFPPLYDKPKGLFSFRGEVLIERQIRQLKEAGIDDVTVVIGYEKERFFYLEQRFGVRLVVSTKYNDESNLSSLDLVRDRLGGGYLCCADHWYESNPFRREGYDRSVRLVGHAESAEREIVVSQRSDGRLDDMRSGAPSGMCMVGFAYVTDDFARRFFELYDEEKGYIGVKNLLWEQFWGRHADELPLYGEPAPEGMREFDSLADLQRIDSGVLENVSYEAIANIQRLLGCDVEEICDIEPLNKGLTNVSFSFSVAGERYVYRHPGASSSNLVNREAEVVAQELAGKLGIDSSVMTISERGWKLSRFVEATRDFTYDDPDLLARGVAQIRAFHDAGGRCDYEVDLLAEGDRLMGLASSKKGGLKERYADVRTRLGRLWHHVELDGVPKVLCHNDTYAVNWIVSEGGLDLIDWEYAGMNDPVNDIATLVVRDGLDDELAEELLRLYYGRALAEDERRHAYGCFALCGWYWLCWSLYKDTLGEDGFFMLSAWRALETYLERALALYEREPSRVGALR